jgi:hypothetical protein
MGTRNARRHCRLHNRRILQARAREPSASWAPEKSFLCSSRFQKELGDNDCEENGIYCWVNAIHAARFFT